jgi:hypothetical protein
VATTVRTLGAVTTPASAAIVDRLTFGGNIIKTGTDSYRLATTRPPGPNANQPAELKRPSTH